ncbi:MAG: 4Fe-4S double cluster binding domain-containing protein [Promethearchaeota archaeon]
MLNKSKILKNFQNSLAEKNYKGLVISAKHIRDLHNDIEKHNKKELFDPLFYYECLSYFEFEPVLNLPEKYSLFIVAVPQPSFKVNFIWKNENVPLLIPPTYLYGQKVIDEVKEILEGILHPEGYKVVYARIPFKTLAVRSGLAKYGRNNITYISEMGSFYRLAAFYSDFPIEKDSWQELKMMELCENCSACINNCPTQAISSERFLLHAERCITFHNEHPRDIPFPKWLDSSWHNCLVGCLHCQRVCPANKKVFKWIEQGPIFSEEETKEILEGNVFEQISGETAKKLANFDLNEFLELFPRNLSVFLKK